MPVAASGSCSMSLPNNGSKSGSVGRNGGLGSVAEGAQVFTFAAISLYAVGSFADGNEYGCGPLVAVVGSNLSVRTSSKGSAFRQSGHSSTTIIRKTGE